MDIRKEVKWAIGLDDEEAKELCRLVKIGYEHSGPPSEVAARLLDELPKLPWQ